MLKVLKIPLFILLFIFLTLFYAIYTQSGQKRAYSILGYILSQKNDLLVKIKYIDLKEFPYIKTELNIEKKYKLLIDGYYRDRAFDMQYKLTSECIESNICKIKDDVRIYGTINGPSGNIHITGEGIALDGNISYEATKHRHSFDDITLEVNDINSSKLFTLLGENAILTGKANAYLHFDTIAKKTRKGFVRYHVIDKNYHNLKVTLDAQVDVANEKHTFTMHAKTPTAKLRLVNGIYDLETRKGKANYLLDIQNLADLKSFLKVKINSPFYSVGKLNYDKKLTLEGFSESFGGMLDIVLKGKKLHFYLHDTPLPMVMKKLQLDPIFDTNITGVGLYDLKNKTLQFDAQLSDVQFKKSKITENILEKSNIDIAKEHFIHNTLNIHTLKGKLSSTLKLQNKKNHLYLKDTQINSDNNSVDTHIDLHMYQYFLKGKLHIKLDKYTASNDTYLHFDGLVQKHYAVKINGLINKSWTSMDYGISAARLPSNICTIVDDINITGHVSGPFNHLRIGGEGKAMEGHVSFNTVKEKETFLDTTIQMTDIHAKKLATLLGNPNLPSGKVDINATFDIYNKGHKKGKVHLVLRKSKYYDLPLQLESDIKVRDTKHFFTATIHLDNAKIELSKGLHNEDTNTSNAFYTLDVKELKAFKSIFGHPYQGSFYAMGEVKYGKNIEIHGLSKSFYGITEFNYDEKHLNIELRKISLKNFMRLFPYTVILDADTSGSIVYDFTKKRLDVKTRLANARFLHTDIVDTIYQKADVNILKERFDISTLDATYQNHTLLGNLSLKNKTSHVLLNNAQINTKHNTINAYFDFKMQGKEFSGKVYGSLKHPEVKLNMQKLIRHEMDKQLDSIVGEGNRKMMENMPMGDVAKDVASGMGGAFMGIFF